MNAKLLLGTGTLAVAIVAGSVGAAPAQSFPNQNTTTMGNRLRGERGSARNLLVERHKIESIIDALQRDRRDYGGHREQTIDLLTQSRAQLGAAIDFERTHPGQ
ncbi:MAG: hypothetical protein M3Y18_09635 [Candidatus Eremiobacteraeota bacterium]|nr:hypothetical protein [Candidatus Eremiobacteraeota bacterium]